MTLKETTREPFALTKAAFLVFDELLPFYQNVYEKAEEDIEIMSAREKLLWLQELIRRTYAFDKGWGDDNSAAVLMPIERIRMLIGLNPSETQSVMTEEPYRELRVYRHSGFRLSNDEPLTEAQLEAVSNLARAQMKSKVALDELEQWLSLETKNP